jgi:glycerol-3-phosphate O-acyltransferase
VVFACEADTPTERGILERWIVEQRPPGTSPHQVRIGYFERPRERIGVAAHEQEVARLVAWGDDPWFVPLKVAWEPHPRDPGRGAPLRLRDLVLFGDPHKPRPAAQRLLTRRPGCYVVLHGGAGRRSWLQRRWRRMTEAGTSGPSFPHFLLMQGVLSLERAEATRLGTQYKVPRLVRDDLRSSVRFQGGLEQLAADLGRPVDDVRTEAEGYLAEMVTGFGRLLIDLWARFGRFVYGLGYDSQLDYDSGQAERVRRTLTEHPAVVLPTHKSMLDSAVVAAAFAELGLPRSHILGGINLAFWPMGALMRRSGVIFIRRKIADNPVYRFTLREYIGYLVERRFNLEWYIEGGRTRTGKLQPPRMGLLAYVADAYVQGRAEDVVLLPVAIAYDQLHEVRDYAREARGGRKQREDLKWMIGYLRAQRANFGRISVRFGEPVSMRAALGPPPPVTGGMGRPDSLALQKMAFEVSVRINRVTPITAISLTAFTLLGAGGRALTIDQVATALGEPLHYAHERGLPLAESAARLPGGVALRSALDELRRHRVLTVFDEGPEPVYVIGPDDRLAAAFYRNSILHFFLMSAIGELALLRAATATDDKVGVFWYEGARLRDLLKFDFFFPEREEYNAELAAEMGRHDSRWEEQVAEGGEVARSLLGSFRPLCAHSAIRPFVEAYLVVADVLAEWPDGVPVDEAAVIERCLTRGRQYLLQQLLHCPEAVSQLLFKTGLQLAGNRGLLETEGPAAGGRERNGSGGTQGSENGLRSARRAFGAELRAVLAATDVVETMAATAFTRRVGTVSPPAMFAAYAAGLSHVGDQVAAHDEALADAAVTDAGPDQAL